MVNTVQFGITELDNTRSEAGKLRDELGYQRSIQNTTKYTTFSLRVTAYLEFGIDLRNNADPFVVQTS